MNNDLHKVVSEIYPFTLMVSADPSKIEGVFGDNNHGNGDYGGFMMAGIRDGCLVVGIHIQVDDDGSINFADLAHEVYHAVVHICEYLGLKPCYGNDEQGAYLTTWIFRWCVDRLRENDK
jgi:hypothetical protein